MHSGAVRIREKTGEIRRAAFWRRHERLRTTETSQLVDPADCFKILWAGEARTHRCRYFTCVHGELLAMTEGIDR